MSIEPEQEKQLPTAEEFLLVVPLYEHYSIKESDSEYILQLEYFNGTIDVHCLECGKESVFSNQSQLPGVLEQSNYRQLNNLGTFIEFLKKETGYIITGWDGKGPHTKKFSIHQFALRPRTFNVELNCSRNDTHKTCFTFTLQSKTIQKTGQHPSIADLKAPEVKQYRRVLGDAKFREFNRAIGLHSHGVGIGAFVYLRRIFEDLIEESHQEAAKAPTWNEEQYSRGRMEDKILLLKNHLPGFLVQNRIIYSILSKGIHDLNEDECLKYFDVSRVSIELILDEKLQAEKRKEKIKGTGKALAEIKRELKG